MVRSSPSPSYENDSPCEICRSAFTTAATKLAAVHQFALNHPALLGYGEWVHVPADRLLDDHEAFGRRSLQSNRHQLSVAIISARRMASAILLGTSPADANGTPARSSVYILV